MSKFIKIWAEKQPKSYKHILFRYGDNRKWRYIQNWKFNFNLPHFNLITPFLRITKCNGRFEIGLGNHYLEIGD